MGHDGHPWREIADRVWIRRFAFFDQTIGAIAGDERVLVVDTRSSHLQGQELLADLRALTRLQPVVVNTHHHFDHAYGNAAFLPCEVWGHERCAARLAQHGESQRARVAAEYVELADEVLATPLEPPRCVFADSAEVDLGGRTVTLRYLGRGHTDNDIVALVADAGVVFAGDLIEEGAPPSFGDSFPLEWPATLGQVLDAAESAVAGDRGRSAVAGDRGRSGADGDAIFVPGHGEPVDADFVRAQMADIAFVTEAARRLDGPPTPATALEIARHLAWPREAAASALARALEQAAGRLR